MGGEKDAPTLLSQLIFKDYYPVDLNLRCAQAEVRVIPGRFDLNQR